MIKKSTIAPKPKGNPAPSLENYLDGAAANLDNRMEDTITAGKAPSKNKKQIPLMIPPALLETLDEVLASTRSGPSRSVWICDAIDMKLTAMGFSEDQQKKADDSSGVSAAESSADA